MAHHRWAGNVQRGAKNSQLAGGAKPCEWGGGRVNVRRGVVLCWQEKAASRK
ncbi:hypothetical protein ACFFJN_03155 [Erwinia mallotivora]|uniref:hypothetical protein n=1 Tax=Erwinia mallotivora TaxID=69222 RepID=UPI0035E65C10